MAAKNSTRRTKPAKMASEMTNAELDALWLKLSPPVIDHAAMMALEEAPNDKSRRQGWRLCLSVLATGLEAHEKLSIEDPECYGEALELAESYLTHAKALAEMAASAVMRLRLADLRGAA